MAAPEGSAMEPEILPPVAAQQKLEATRKNRRPNTESLVLGDTSGKTNFHWNNAPHKLWQRGTKAQEQSSDRFPFPRGENLTVLGRSPDSQVNFAAKLPTFRLPRQKPSGFVKSRVPDYSGGTAPDSHRLPFYALAGTQNVPQA
jgi:hypothetical protein